MKKVSSHIMGTKTGYIFIFLETRETGFFTGEQVPKVGKSEGRSTEDLDFMHSIKIW